MQMIRRHIEETVLEMLEVFPAAYINDHTRGEGSSRKDGRRHDVIASDRRERGNLTNIFSASPV